MSIKEKILQKLDEKYNLSESHSMNMLHLGMMMAAANQKRIHKKTFKELKSGWEKSDEKTHSHITKAMARKKDDGLGNMEHGKHYFHGAYHPAHPTEKGKADDMKIITTRNKSTNPYGRHKVVHKDGKVEYYVDKNPQK